MKKRITQKLAAAVLTASMVFSLAACGNNDSSSQESSTSKASDSSTTSTASSVMASVEDDGVTFPLEEEMTFSIMVCSNGEVEDLEKCDFWQDLYEATNVKIEWIVLPGDTAMSNLNAMFSARQEGDAIMARFIKDDDLSQMIASNLLLPLNEYIDDTELMPNFNERVLAESPETKGVIASPDGNIYSLPRYQALEGSYLESPFWINKAWLDQLGKEVPTTLEELEEVLIAFRDNDMNGNGKTDDEIPYLIKNGHSNAHFEAFLGLYGIPTKDGTYENYVYVEDGKVIFAPTTETYKEAIKTLNDWYEKGLIWSEAFTGSSETFNAKINGSESVVGLINNANEPLVNPDDYVAMEPVKVEGYEAKWYVHPGLKGIKTMFSLTRSCENADVLMKWIDLFYSFENTLRVQYGEEGDGLWEYNADGKVVLNTLTADESAKFKETTPSFNDIIGITPRALTIEDYSERIVLSETQIKKEEAVDLYRPYLNDEIWPRPYLASEVASRQAEMRTDIFNTIKTNKAAWITGERDIEADWESFKNEMKKMGIDEFLRLMQEAYDNYLAAQ